MTVSTEWTGFVNGLTQLPPFGGAGSKTPMGRVTGALSFKSFTSVVVFGQRVLRRSRVIEDGKRANGNRAQLCLLMFPWPLQGLVLWS